MKSLSKPGEYGLRALMYMVARGESNDYVNIREMSKDLDISFHFLTKILQQLTQAGILMSIRGPNGGVAFRRSPNEIKLMDILTVIEGPQFLTECVLGLPGCGDFAPCPLHESWAPMRQRLRHLFETTTIAETGKAVQLGRLRLAP